MTIETKVPREEKGREEAGWGTHPGAVFRKPMKERISGRRD